MGKGENVPAGVRYFDGTGVSKSTKGAHHPKSIRPGLEDTKKLSGSDVGADMGGSKSKSAIPSAVAKHSGTENPRVKEKRHPSPTMRVPYSGKSDRVPGDVKRHDGLKAPKRAK